MIHAPNILLIGSAGRNSGKTTFACALLRRLSASHGIVAAKVTTIRERGGACPRGGEGCGVCAALDGKYCITEETSPGGTKDTQRLLAAGASKVYWLRVMSEYLEEGAQTLLELVGSHCPVICESNSLRTVVQPGAFLLFRHRDQQEIKASARAVRQHVDRTVYWDGFHFDLEPSVVNVVNAEWAFAYDAGAIILAGGKSARMGHDKALLPYGGVPLIQHIRDRLSPHFKTVCLAANDPGRFAFLKCRVVPDEAPGHGPLTAIISALRTSPHDMNLIVACDMPAIDTALIRRMVRTATQTKTHVVVPRARGPYTEPLFAIYRKEAIHALDAAFTAGIRSVREAVAACEVHYLDLDADMAIPNVNTMDDYTRLATQPETGE